MRYCTGCKQLLKVLVNFSEIRPAYFLQKFFIHTVFPLPVKMLRQPGAGGGAHGILYPSTHFFATDGSNTGYIQSICAKIFFCPFLVGVFYFPEPAGIRRCEVKVIGGVTRPVT